MAKINLTINEADALKEVIEDIIDHPFSYNQEMKERLQKVYTKICRADW